MDFNDWIRLRISNREYNMKEIMPKRLQKQPKLLVKWIQTTFMRSSRSFIRLWARLIFWTSQSSKKHYLRRKIEIRTQMPFNCEHRVFKRLHQFCMIKRLFNRRCKALDQHQTWIRGWTLGLFRIWTSISLVRQSDRCTCPSPFERCTTKSSRCVSLSF